MHSLPRHLTLWREINRLGRGLKSEWELELDLDLELKLQQLWLLAS